MTMKTAISGPSILPFETTLNGKQSSEWMLGNRRLLLYSCILYMAVAYLCRSFMKTRRPIFLRTPMLIWNITLAAFSVFGAIRMIPAMLYVIRTVGAEGTLCRNLHSLAPQSAQFWIWLYVISQTLQLTDGLFSILRKKEYASFYCYYRMSTMVIAFYTYGLHPSEIMWYALADYIFNVAVYSSYALKALNVRTPLPLTTALVLGQIFRAVLGFAITIKAIDTQLAGSTCEMSVDCAFLNLAFFFSFIVIFCGYFYDVWFVGARKDRSRSVPIFINLVDKFILFLKTFNTLYQGEDDDEMKDL